MRPNDTILITGGCGFIGAHCIRHFQKQFKNPIIVLDKMTYAADKAFANELLKTENTLIKGCITDSHLLETIFKQHNVAHVIHFAAESHVDNSIENPDLFIKTNVLGTHCLLRTALQHWQPNLSAHRFHHISTDEVFGSLTLTQAPFTETSPYLPNSPYSASKASSDHLVRCYHKTYGLNTVITHCSNNFGPGQHPEKLIPKVINACLNNKPIPLYGKGENIRDWLFVKDHCLGIEQVFCLGQAGETYCIGGRKELTNLELIKALCKELDALLAGEFQNSFLQAPTQCETLIHFVQDRPGHDLRYAIDDTKREKKLGPLPITDFKIGLQSTIRYYLEQALGACKGH